MLQLDPEEPLVRWAIFGKEVEAFLRGPIGDYLIRKSEAQIHEATEALKRVAPWRTRRIRELQAEIRHAEQFQNWLGDAVASGHQSIAQLEEEHAGG